MRPLVDEQLQYPPRRKKSCEASPKKKTIQSSEQGTRAASFATAVLCLRSFDAGLALRKYLGGTGIVGDILGSGEGPVEPESRTPAVCFVAAANIASRHQPSTCPSSVSCGTRPHVKPRIDEHLHADWGSFA